MRTIVEMDGATLRRAYLRTGLLLVPAFLLPLLVVFLFLANRGAWYFLLFAFVVALIAILPGLAVRLHLDRKRLLVEDGSIVQMRGEKRLGEIPLEEIERMRAYSPKGSGRLFGLDRVLVTSRSGKQILQPCEDADAVIRTVHEVTDRPDIPVKMETGPRRFHIAAGGLLFAGAMAFMYWGHKSGRGDLVHLFLAAVWFVMGTSLMTFRPMSSRGQSRKVELLLGGFFLLQGCVSLYQFVDFQLSDYSERGIRYACTRRFELAQQALQQAEEAAEPVSRVSYGWGILHFYEKDYGQAEQELLAALQADPTLNDARYQLSRTYWCMERKEEAKALLEQYLDLGGGAYTSAARKALRDNY
jgi:tetratricopeptide (TPR) repeat protein